jgi:hypothetical protein
VTCPQSLYCAEVCCGAGKMQNGRSYDLGLLKPPIHMLPCMMCTCCHVVCLAHACRTSDLTLVRSEGSCRGCFLEYQTGTYYMS